MSTTATDLEKALKDTTPQTVEELIEIRNRARQARPILARYGIDESKLTDQEVVEKVDKINNLRAENVQVLSRGPVVDGLKRILDMVPAGLIGQFILNTPMQIQRAESLGWKVHTDKNLAQESPTPSASNHVIMGDCVLMTIPEEMYVAQLMERDARIAEKRKRNEFRLGVPQGDGKVEADPEFPVFKI